MTHGKQRGEKPLTSGLDALLNDIVGNGRHSLCFYILNCEAIAGLRNLPLGLWRLLCSSSMHTCLVAFPEIPTSIRGQSRKHQHARKHELTAALLALYRLSRIMIPGAAPAIGPSLPKFLHP